MSSRSLLPGFALALLAGGLAAQGDLQERYESKVAEDWVTANPWVLDYDEARARAKASGKPIFAYFTRSFAY